MTNKPANQSKNITLTVVKNHNSMAISLQVFQSNQSNDEKIKTMKTSTDVIVEH